VRRTSREWIPVCLCESRGEVACRKGGLLLLGREVLTLHAEYVKQRTQYVILFIFSLFCEYMHLEYVRMHVLCRVNQAEYAIRILKAAPQEYVNTYSTRRVLTWVGSVGASGGSGAEGPGVDPRLFNVSQGARLRVERGAYYY